MVTQFPYRSYPCKMEIFRRETRREDRASMRYLVCYRVHNCAPSMQVRALLNTLIARRNPPISSSCGEMTRRRASSSFSVASASGQQATKRLRRGSEGSSVVPFNDTLHDGNFLNLFSDSPLSSVPESPTEASSLPAPQPSIHATWTRKAENDWRLDGEDIAAMRGVPWTGLSYL